MHRSSPHRAVALGLLPLLLVTAACSSSPDSNSSPGNKNVAVGGAQFSTADAETAALGSDAADGVFPRTIKHANGTATLEKKPQRIVVLDNGELDAVVSLGITPVGLATTKGVNPVPSYLADKVSNAQSIGDLNNLNLEKIASLKPDLILGNKLRADKLYPQLSQIAPTVLSIRPGFPWKENFLLVGEALGMEKETTAILNRYAASAAELKKVVPATAKVSLVRFMPGKLRLYANKSLIGVILKDAGIARPANQSIDELATEISAENIGQADADWIFYSSYGDPDATGESSVVNGAAWKTLSAVASGKAKRVNDDVWYLGLGPTGANQILEELRGILTAK